MRLHCIWRFHCTHTHTYIAFSAMEDVWEGERGGEREGEDKQQGCHLAYSYIQGTCADTALLGCPLSLQSCHLAIVPSLFGTVRCLHRITDKPALHTWLALLVIIFRETERESEIERDKDYQMAPLSDKSCSPHKEFISLISHCVSTSFLS